MLVMRVVNLSCEVVKSTQNSREMKKEKEKIQSFRRKGPMTDFLHTRNLPKLEKEK